VAGLRPQADCLPSLRANAMESSNRLDRMNHEPVGRGHNTRIGVATIDAGFVWCVTWFGATAVHSRARRVVEFMQAGG